MLSNRHRRSGSLEDVSAPFSFNRQAILANAGGSILLLMEQSRLLWPIAWALTPPDPRRRSKRGKCAHAAHSFVRGVLRLALVSVIAQALPVLHWLLVAYPRLSAGLRLRAVRVAAKLYEQRCGKPVCIEMESDGERLELTTERADGGDPKRYSDSHKRVSFTQWQATSTITEAVTAKRYAHMLLLMEAVVESVPQSLLQLTAMGE